MWAFGGRPDHLNTMFKDLCGQILGLAAVFVSAAFLGLALVNPPAVAQAAAGGYSFDGGTGGERAAVPAALGASSFDWSLVPGHVTIHITRGGTLYAGRGEIWLSAKRCWPGPTGLRRRTRSSGTRTRRPQRCLRPASGRCLAVSSRASSHGARHPRESVTNFPQSLLRALSRCQAPSRKCVQLEGVLAEDSPPGFFGIVS